MEYVMRRYGLEEKLDTISTLHGKKFKAKASFGTFSFVPLYHPAVAVYNRTTLPDLKEDFEVLKKFL